jgi:hypothetical protein
MTLTEFVAAVPGFASLSHQDRIVHFAWWLHAHGGKERIDQAAVRGCYETLHLTEPNLSQEFSRLTEKKRLLKDGGGYRLEHKERAKLDGRYGQHETTIAVSQMMKDLIGKVSDQGEKIFLAEAIKCYHVKAFRAAIVMAWNLAYDHLLNWVLADAGRLASFNSKIVARVGAKKGSGMAMGKREDFEDLKESEVLDICSKAGLFASDNTKKILDVELTKRNMAAHPSTVVLGGPAADEAISSLVENVVLILT